MQAKKELGIFWFRNDLRLADNAGLLELTESCQSFLPLYLFTPTQLAPARLSRLPRLSLRRSKHLQECLDSLSEALTELGSSLFIRQGSAASVFSQLMELSGLTPEQILVHVSAEPAPEEEADLAEIRHLGIEVREFETGSLYKKNDLGFPLESVGPQFTSFRKRLESLGTVTSPVRAPDLLPPLPDWTGECNSLFLGSCTDPFPPPTPSLRDGEIFPDGASPQTLPRQEVHEQLLDEYPQSIIAGLQGALAVPQSLKDNQGFGDFVPIENNPQTYSENRSLILGLQGGREAGLKRLKHYLWDTDCIATYKETRNNLLGQDNSSKFSVYLALGCISAREIYAELKSYEAERGANESTYWLYFELLWRDFFRWQFMLHGKAFFSKAGVSGKASFFRQDKNAFEHWKQGKTGERLIDAGMKELASTGYTSNRARQNVASYLAKVLCLDWRLGAEYFESVLVDYDVYSNWGNWAYLAGTGNDPRDRVFNPERQANIYDPAGVYRETWD